MTAVFINCFTIILGSAIGLIFARKISPAVSVVVSDAAGIITIILGVSMALEKANVVFLALSLILGGLLGTRLDIERAIVAAADACARALRSLAKKRTRQDADSAKNEPCDSAAFSERQNSFGYAFLNASVLFCVGAMSLVGSFKAGVEGDYSIILTKSVLDGFMAIVFAASMGAGTLFSFIAVLLYQGFLTLASSRLSPFVNETMLSGLSAAGGALVLMIGIGLLKLRDIKTANYLPAIIFMAAFILCEPYIIRAREFFTAIFG